MKDASPGPVTINIFQFGLEKPDTLKLNAYAEAASLDRLTLSAGDAEALLKGTRLDEVAKVTVAGVTWTPGTLTREEDVDNLKLSAADSTAGLEPGKAYLANVDLRDGRHLKAPVTVNPPRPQVELLSKGIQDNATDASPVRLGSPDDLPLSGRLVFFLKSKVPTNFPRTEKVEVAAPDLSFHTTLSLADGGLMLEDANTAIGTMEPLTRFGSSAFGRLQARPVSADGTAGDWLPLGTLVRLPGFKELHCPRVVAKPCALTGSDLFLATSVGTTADMDNATEVPPDFTGTQLSVPHPVNGTLYLRLRDDPQTVQTLTLPVMPMAPAALSKLSAPQQAPPAPLAASPAAPLTAPTAPPPGQTTTDAPAKTGP
jgi:hypothetical protein